MVLTEVLTSSRSSVLRNSYALIKGVWQLIVAHLTAEDKRS